MTTRINCIDSSQGVWCKNKNVPRSLFGFGARCCLVAEGKTCPFQIKYPKPAPPPSPSPAPKHKS